MPDGRTHDVTALLIEWRGGDYEAIEQLLPLVDDELRRLATRHTWRLTMTAAREFVRRLTEGTEAWPDEADGA